MGESPSNCAVALLPRLELLALALGQVAGAPGSRLALLGGERPLELLGEEAERQLRVGHDARVDGEVLRDLVSVELDVHDLRVLREDTLERGEDLREDVRARRSVRRRPRR